MVPPSCLHALRAAGAVLPHHPCMPAACIGCVGLTCAYASATVTGMKVVRLVVLYGLRAAPLALAPALYFYASEIRLRNIFLVRHQQQEQQQQQAAWAPEARPCTDTAMQQGSGSSSGSVQGPQQGSVGEQAASLAMIKASTAQDRVVGMPQLQVQSPTTPFTALQQQGHEAGSQASSCTSNTVNLLAGMMQPGAPASAGQQQSDAGTVMSSSSRNSHGMPGQVRTLAHVNVPAVTPSPMQSEGSFLPADVQPSTLTPPVHVVTALSTQAWLSTSAAAAAAGKAVARRVQQVQAGMFAAQLPVKEEAKRHCPVGSKHIKHGSELQTARPDSEQRSACVRMEGRLYTSQGLVGAEDMVANMAPTKTSAADNEPVTKTNAGTKHSACLSTPSLPASLSYHGRTTCHTVSVKVPEPPVGYTAFAPMLLAAAPGIM